MPIRNVTLKNGTHFLDLAETKTILKLVPTELRKDPLYIRVYILWMNLIFLILGPFVVLGILNYRVYTRIKKYERTLRDTLRSRSTMDDSMPTEDERNGSLKWIRSCLRKGHRSQSETGLGKSYKFKSKMVLKNGGTKNKDQVNDLIHETDNDNRRQSPTVENSILMHPESSSRNGSPDERINKQRSNESARSNSSSNNLGRKSSLNRSRINSKRRRNNSLTAPRKREVLLSRISIYIVFMFVICHRWV